MTNRPTERRQSIAAAGALRAQGLTARDIASALKLSEAAVLDLLHEADHGVPKFAAARPVRTKRI